MRRWAIVSALLGAALALAVVATAVAAKPAKPPKAQPHPNHVKLTVTTVDSNSCLGTPWATDTVKRKVKVHQLTGGATPTYRVKIEDNGTFSTTGGSSPGNCPQNKKHGTAVLAGKTGKVKGSMTGTVSGGVFNPGGFNAATTCTVAVPCTTAVFIAAIFSGTGTYSCTAATSSDCNFNYKYKAKDQNLIFRKYSRKGTGAGTALVQHVKGDIATT